MFFWDVLSVVTRGDCCIIVIAELIWVIWVICTKSGARREKGSFVVYELKHAAILCVSRWLISTLPIAN